MKDYVVIVCNREAHSFDSQEKAQVKADEYTNILAQVVYWPDKDKIPTILSDNRAVRVRYALDNNLI